jgi:hypothetical protein
MIFGILNIGFALFGLLALLLTVFVMSRMSFHQNPFLEQLHNNPTYIAWMRISTPVGGVVSVALLAAGIGLLLLQNWARIFSICYAIYAIIGTVLGFVIMLNVCMAVLNEGVQGTARAGMIGAMFGAVIGMVFGMVYPILLLIFMTRPKIIAAFRPEPAPQIA